MKYSLLLFGLFVSLVPNLFAQTENTAPVIWERYRHSDLDVSVNLPKMPVLIANYDTCKEELKRSGYVYAENAVYEFTVVAGGIRQGVRPRVCSSDKAPFDQSTIDRRLDQLRQVKGAVETKTRVANLDAFQFKEERSVRVIIPDVVHKRLVELAVVHYVNEIPDTDRFFGSMQFDANTGKEIADGATQTLGDAVQEQPAQDPAAAEDQMPIDKNRVVTAILIAAKPHARYTDQARKAGEKGTVRLKVTLQANGAVGTVAPVTQLKHGLTEQAVWAARRVVFLPKRIDGKAVNTTLSVEYSFSIY